MSGGRRPATEKPEKHTARSDKPRSHSTRTDGRARPRGAWPWRVRAPRAPGWGAADRPGRRRRRHRRPPRSVVVGLRRDVELPTPGAFEVTAPAAHGAGQPPTGGVRRLGAGRVSVPAPAGPPWSSPAGVWHLVADQTGAVCSSRPSTHVPRTAAGLVQVHRLPRLRKDAHGACSSGVREARAASAMSRPQFSHRL